MCWNKYNLHGGIIQGIMTHVSHRNEELALRCGIAPRILYFPRLINLLVLYYGSIPTSDLLCTGVHQSMVLVLYIQSTPL